MKIIGWNLAMLGFIVPTRTHRALIWISRLDKNPARFTPPADMPAQLHS